jgi:hypothetical protein
LAWTTFFAAKILEGVSESSPKRSTIAGGLTIDRLKAVVTDRVGAEEK